MENKRDNSYIYFVAAALLIIADQVTKLLIKGFNFLGIEHQGLHFGELIPVIGDFLQITYVENPGMAFGISFGTGKIFLSLFSLVAGVLLAIYLHKLKGFSPWVRIGIMLILAGALGNFIDRAFYGVIFGESALFYGRVVDFIQVNIPDVNIMGLRYTHWPVFNIADSCVTVGVVILLIFHNKIPTFKALFGKSDENEENSEKMYNESET